MSTETTRITLPFTYTHAGVILSSRLAAHDQPFQIVRYTMEGEAFEAIALPSPWLEKVLETPLEVNELTLVECDGEPASRPFLMGEATYCMGHPLDHLPETICPMQGIVAGIRQLIACIETAPLRYFVLSVLDRRDVHRAFWTMPASARHHHSHPGGLALHSWEVASDIANHRGLTEIEHDLAIAGALLHDIGKVWSYTDDMFPNEAGMAMGHELVGLAKLEQELAYLEMLWPDGAYVMRCVLSGQARKRGNSHRSASTHQGLRPT